MQYYKAKEYFDTYIKDRYHDSIGKFKASYEYANIQHFLGNYDSAIETLEILKTQLSETNPNELNILKDVIILLSHIHKHVGKFLIGYDLLNKKEHLFKGNINYNRHFFSLLIFSIALAILFSINSIVCALSVHQSLLQSLIIFHPREFKNLVLYTSLSSRLSEELYALLSISIPSTYLSNFLL